eukprot:m.45965 g.45965  ORF g.45965 m.45965 type:complete len:86 (-) comp8702_c0_seq1:8-265(-)
MWRLDPSNGLIGRPGSSERGRSSSDSGSSAGSLRQRLPIAPTAPNVGVLATTAAEALPTVFTDRHMVPSISLTVFNSTKELCGDQ